MESLGFIADITFIQALILIAGLILVIIEMFHPGFGAPGITGGILLVLGIVLTAKTLLQALILIVIVLAILGMVLTAVLRSAVKGKLSRSPLILTKESSYIGTEDLDFFLGKEGIASTVLRPAGTVDFDGVKVDVVSEGEFIQPGKNVRVIKVEGRRIVVREV